MYQRATWSRSKASRLVLIILTVAMTHALFSQTPKPQADPAKQASQAKEESDYQNLQRARRLLLMKSEIKALDDLAMRCLVRLEMVRFIYEADVRAEFDSADAVSVDYFEDIAANAGQIPDWDVARWQNFILPLIRQKSPDLAKKLEKKYLGKTDTSVADLQELNPTNTKQIAERTIEKILRGDVSNYVLSIHDRIRPTDPVSADNILAALLTYYERTPDTGKFALFLDFVRQNYVAATTPVELKRRYLVFVLSRSRSQVSDADTGPTAKFVLRMLKAALPSIQETLPDLYTEAQAISVVLDARLNKDNRAREEAMARIEASDDKLRQVIAEAEATDDKDLKDFYWNWAARLALEDKKYRMAVDLNMKIEPGEKDDFFNIDAFLIYHVLPQAIKGKDLEAAEYTIKSVHDDEARADGLFVLAKGYLDDKDKQQAFETFERALKVLEKGESNADKASAILENVPTALAIDKVKGFETVSLAIKLVNRLPTPTAEDKIGTPSRQKYLQDILMRIAWKLIPTFKALAKSDVGFASTTADEIRLKDWKLLTYIIVETERKYPMPPKTKLAEQ